MPAAMPCKRSINSGGETYCGIAKSKTKHACTVEADESTRIRLEGAPCRYHEDHFAAKAINSLSHYNLVHNFIPLPQAFKNTNMQRLQWKKKVKNWRKYGHDSWRKSETKKRWSMKKGMKEEKFILRHWWIFVMSRIRSWSQNFKYKGRVVLRRGIWKDNSGLYAVCTEQGSSDSQMTAAKVMDVVSRLPGCTRQAADTVSAYTRVRMEDAPTLLNVKMSRYLDTSTKAQMAQIMVQYGRSGCSSWAKSIWSPFGRTVMGKAIWENPIAARLGEGFRLGMLIRTPWKRVVLICVCGWHQVGWKETKHWSDVESTQ